MKKITKTFIELMEKNYISMTTEKNVPRMETASQNLRIIDIFIAHDADHNLLLMILQWSFHIQVNSHDFKKDWTFGQAPLKIKLFSMIMKSSQAKAFAIERAENHLKIIYIFIVIFYS